jgi:hypothetical protein
LRRRERPETAAERRRRSLMPWRIDRWILASATSLGHLDNPRLSESSQRHDRAALKANTIQKLGRIPARNSL